MADLEKLRKEIDTVDAEIVRAFERRIALARQVAEYKMSKGLSVLDRQRETEVLKKREEMLEDATLIGDIDRIFELLMSISRTHQRKLIRENRHAFPGIVPTGKIGYSGVRGAYADMAQNEYFDGRADALSYKGFEEVFAAVEAGEVEYGVVPIENSYAGSVEQVYDLLHQYDVHIVGEQLLHIEHALLGLPGTELSQIKEVYSHEQALVQSTEFLRAYPAWEQIPYYNTAASAEYVAQSKDSSKAAIASVYTADIYGLEVLKAAISSSDENTTRFIVVSAKSGDSKAADKASISFVLEHKPGALAHILDVFADIGLNMAKIESRPLKHRNFEYRFYVDFVGSGIGNVLSGAMEQISQYCEQLRLLGIYENRC